MIDGFSWVVGGEAGEEEVGGGDDLAPFHNHRPELGLHGTGMGGSDQVNSISVRGYQWLRFYLRACSSGRVSCRMLHALSYYQHGYARASP